MNKNGRKLVGPLARLGSVALSVGMFCPGAHSQDIQPWPTGPASPWDLDTFLHWGAVRIKPAIAGSMYYDDNIRISPTNPESDLILTLTPSVVAVFGEAADVGGNSVSLAYAPTFNIYTKNSDADSVNQDIHLAGELNQRKLKLSLSQDVQYITGTVVDVGNLVSRWIYTTALSTRYAVGAKTSVGLDALQSINDYGNLNGFNEWTIQGVVDYRPRPKLSVGLRVAGAWRDIRQGPNETYQQITVNGSYVVTQKISVNANIGVEVRQFQGGFDEGPAPVFGLSGFYQMTSGTSFTLEAHLRNQSSVNPSFSSQNYTDAGFSAAVRQRFYEKYFLSATGGYENSDYHANQAGVTATRVDGYFFIGLALDTNLNKKWNVGAYYQYRENTSNDPIYGFTDNQIGLRSTYRF